MTTLLTDLLAFYPLTETRGDARCHTSKYLLQPYNYPGSAAGKVGTYARQFVAANSQYLSVSDAAFQMGDVDFTICAWVYADTLAARAQIVRKGVAIIDTPGSQFIEYGIWYEPIGQRFVFSTRDASDTATTDVTADTLGAPATATWYFVVAQHDAANNLIKISVNNGAFDSVAFTGGTFVGASPLRLGASSDPLEFWDGRIEGVGIWKRLLSAAEITALYNSGSGRAYPFGVSLYGTLTWHCDVDWNGDGIYESDEASRLIGVPALERGQSSRLDDPMVGACELVLDNHDGRFDAWQASSPLYPNLGINRRVRVEAEMAGVCYPIFSGRIGEARASGFRAAGATGGTRRMTLRVYDNWRPLQTHRVDASLQQDITQQDAIAALLNAVGFTQATGLWILGTGALGSTTVLGGLYGENTYLGTDEGDTIPYWWLFNDEEPFVNFCDLVRAHFGRAHILADGKLIWRTVAADNGTPTDLTLTDAILQEMNVVHRFDDVRNKIAALASPRALGSLSAIWTLNETPYIVAGESRTFVAEYTNASGERVPAINTVSPVATTDYTANTAEDGNGTDLTSAFSVTRTAYASHAEITITNGGATAGYVTLLQLRGQAVDNLEAQAMVAEDTASQQNYGLQEFAPSLRWQQSTLVANDLATFALRALKDPTATMELRFENQPVALRYDLGAKIQDGTTSGAGGTYRIGKIMHEVPDGYGCQRIFTTWTLTPDLPDDAWILGTHALGTTTVLGF